MCSHISDVFGRTQVRTVSRASICREANHVDRTTAAPEAPDGGRHGINDYTGWFAGDANMKGNYYGYDGPCPPWNDSIVHHYVFTLYALDTAHLNVHGDLNGANVRAALAGHVLSQAHLSGTYTLNPRLR